MSNQPWIRSAGLVIFGFICSMPATYAATAMHHHMPSPSTVARSAHDYVVPPVTLIDQHGRELRLDQALARDKPALVQFFFTSCTTICGVRSAQLVAAAPALRNAGIDIGFYTITIDPDRDTPAHLLAFSRQFGGVPPANWHLLTGSVASIVATPKY